MQVVKKVYEICTIIERDRDDRHMMNGIVYIIWGYLSGSILYADIFGHLLKHKDIIKESKDKNPGTANAFMQGGFLCGFLTLVFDILKGFLPVFLYMHSPVSGKYSKLLLSLVLAAPVWGHIFPVFYHFKGGKGIATTFGCLLGLFPYMEPVLVLAFFFLFFSLILRVTPHYDRTIFTYSVSLFMMKLLKVKTSIVMGFLLIVVSVFIRLYYSTEERDKRRVRLLWMH